LAKKAYVNSQDYEKAAAIRDKINNIRYQKDAIEVSWKEAVKVNQNLIDENDIYRVISEITGIPVTHIAENESEKLLKLEDYLHKTVIGQDEAIKAVASSIRRRRAGISSHRRPLGSFIFLGPTGVGKTLLAKTLAEFLFGSPDSLLRIDMSDYMEKHNSSRLVGSPPGYIGYDEGGVLTEKVRRKPYCVVLFDEIEKAHPDVFNLLLQILEEGEIQDNLGHRVSFRNAVIVMTSNAGARDISTGFSLGFKKDNNISNSEIKSSALNELKRIFRPEFLNRVDDIVVFESLTKDHMSNIFDSMIGELKERVAERNIEIKVTGEAKTNIIDSGMDSRYGARPLRRVIQNSIEDELSTLVIKGIITTGTTAVVDVKDDKVVVYKEIITIPENDVIK
jgi:ATP-dependent Clp protease ATP-binding subunit ClpC